MARIKLSAGVMGVILALGAAGAGVLSAQEPDAKKDSSKSKRAAWLHQVYLREASAYEYFLDEQKQEELKLRREPVMRWTSDGDYNGEVYVWTHHGAAAIVGCIFSGPNGSDQRRIMHEFHSLAPKPLHAGARGATGWLSPGQARPVWIG